ncbi:unnamed protein product [Rotaria sp. Silwood1]|nr:unnamed protein product [Rotaria sp. Silwood1]CAF3529271.1 unnamed protein product [Rotaria sp. Silwood1]CAF3625829.1 unnamed protein product [Rotaria sp. Silwood1]CAF4586352.1 unnamed protein product [Rotaria sp. Silwood1]CAF4637653.1 unnamed protein product [Rotaria sp. Silwood1]
MKYTYEINDVPQELAEQLLNTFRSPFWVDEHRWFVRCDSCPTRGWIFIYTLPYAFDDFSVYGRLLSKSTCPQEKNLQTYDCVRELTYDVEPSTCSQLSDIQFNKPEKMRIRLPVDDYFWSIVPTFDHLTSLQVQASDINEECTKQFQLLLSRASHLSSLSIWIFFNSGHAVDLLLGTKHVSIKRIDLGELSDGFDEEQCMRLSRSPFAMQCEELRIHVTHRSSICYLVKMMPNLRSLYVYCQYDQPEETFSKNELVDWLREQLLGVRPLIEISRSYNTVRLEMRQNSST